MPPKGSKRAASGAANDTRPTKQPRQSSEPDSGDDEGLERSTSWARNKIDELSQYVGWTPTSSTLSRIVDLLQITEWKIRKYRPMLFAFVQHFDFVWDNDALYIGSKEIKGVRQAMWHKPVIIAGHLRSSFFLGSQGEHLNAITGSGNRVDNFWQPLIQIFGFDNMSKKEQNFYLTGVYVILKEFSQMRRQIQSWNNGDLVLVPMSAEPELPFLPGSTWMNTVQSNRNQESERVGGQTAHEDSSHNLEDSIPSDEPESLSIDKPIKLASRNIPALNPGAEIRRLINSLRPSVRDQATQESNSTDGSSHQKTEQPISQQVMQSSDQVVEPKKGYIRILSLTGQPMSQELQRQAQRKIMRQTAQQKFYGDLRTTDHQRRLDHAVPSTSSSSSALIPQIDQALHHAQVQVTRMASNQDTSERVGLKIALTFPTHLLQKPRLDFSPVVSWEFASAMPTRAQVRRSLARYVLEDAEEE